MSGIDIVSMANSIGSCPIVPIRYFFICTVGVNPNGTIVFNNFDIKGFKFPSFKSVIETSNTKFPNLRDVALISISEISESDWKLFSSEQ